MENLLHLATCPIHLNFFDNPIVLTCQHAYCRKCIVAWIRKSEQNKYCPECRAPINYTINEINDLALSRVHQELVQMAKSQNSDLIDKRKSKKKMKISFVGYQAAGKTSLMRSICGFPFMPNVPTTIGVDLATLNYEIDNEPITLNLWDTAGQEKFRSIVRSHYRQSNGIILVYDVTFLDSFLALESWVKDITANAPNDLVVLLIGNKIDIPDERCVSHEQAKQFAERNNFLYYETSARTGENVKEAFDRLVSKINNLTVADTATIRVKSSGEKRKRSDIRQKCNC